jgi:predicted phosphodiesterase
MNTKRSLVDKLRKKFGGKADTVTLVPDERVRLSGKGLRIEGTEASYSIEMGKQIVHLCPDRPLSRTARKAPYDYLLFDPDRYHHGIANCLRLKPGKKLSIDHRDGYQKLVFNKPKHAFRRHLQVSHEGDALVFLDPISELGTYLSMISKESQDLRIDQDRLRALKRIREIYGGPLQHLQADSAMHTLQEVIREVRREPYRQKDSLGNAGSVVKLPSHMTPVIVGDLHAQVDNLLKILIENSLIDSLDRKEAVLILLGDAVHLESEGLLEDMESSVLIMDLIFKLKLAYPEQVFFITGNHDSFSPDVMKGGVPQSVLWQKRLLKLRGQDYCQELDLFYHLSALVVMSDDFIACHAGPPCSKVSFETLVEARQFPKLVHELTWNRIKSKNWLVGYQRGDVKRFRKSLGLDDTVPFIVAHYPQNKKDTLWLNINEIPNHHIVFSARTDQIGLFKRVDWELIPQLYPAEPLIEAVNAIADPLED